MSHRSTEGSGERASPPATSHGAGVGQRAKRPGPCLRASLPRKDKWIQWWMW